MTKLFRRSLQTFVITELRNTVENESSNVNTKLHTKLHVLVSGNLEDQSRREAGAHFPPAGVRGAGRASQGPGLWFDDGNDGIIMAWLTM